MFLVRVQFHCLAVVLYQHHRTLVTDTAFEGSGSGRAGVAVAAPTVEVGD